MLSEINRSGEEASSISFTRAARILAIAEQYFGSRQQALDWLDEPDHALGGIASSQAIDTDLGVRQVENILGRIGYGGIS